MAARSTRNKIRWHADKSVRKVADIESHLKQIDDLSEGSSEYINQALPTLTVLLNEMAKVLIAFKEGL